MKRICILFLGTVLLSTTACNKKAADGPQPAFMNAATLAKSGSGSGGSSGGGSTTTGIIQSFVSGGASRLVATRPDSMLVVFNAPVPAAGYTLTFSSSDPAVQPPSSLFVPAGATSQYVVLASTAVSTARNVTITVFVSGQSKSNTIKLYPLTANIPAPSLQSPGNGAGFDYHRQVVFDWSDLNDAYYYEIQVASSTAFTTLNFHSGPLVSTTVADYFDGSGVRYWRVRGVDASNNGGAWSAVRSFTVKPQ
jgi:hypothetical protein